MSLVTFLKDASIVASVLGLILVGFVVAVRSEPGSTTLAKVSGLFRTVVAVSGVLFVLVMAQSVVGFHVGSRW